MPKVKGTIRIEVQLCLKSCLINNLKTIQANLMKLHRKIKHNENVCHAQEIGSYSQGQGYNQGSEVKLCLWDDLKLAKENFVNLMRN